MDKPKQQKKKLITSFEKLNEEIKELFKEEYTEGYSQHIQKIAKPNGETIFVVPLETEDTTYMIKVDVRVDSKFSEEEIEKEIFALPKDAEGADFTAELEEEEKDNDKKSYELKHGAYEETELDDDDDEEDDDNNDEEEEDDEK